MPEFYKYYVLDCNSLQGVRYYASYEEANDAAASRNAYHGRQFWTVREVWLCNDPYAADQNPYLTHWR